MSQDVIVTVNVDNQFMIGSVKKIESNIIYFTEKSTGKQFLHNTKKVGSVIFNPLGDTIFFPVVRYNLVDCKIDRIGNGNVEYSLPGSVLIHSIGKNKVFACMFENSPKSEKAWYYKTIFDDFNFSFKIKRNEKLIRLNGEDRIVEIDSLINGVIFFKTYEKNYQIRSSITRNKVGKLLFADFMLSPYKNNINDFILTKDDSFQSGKVVAIYSDRIDFKKFNAKTYKSEKLNLLKSDVVAVYFCKLQENTELK